jgi:hypothetical protein
MFPFDYCSLLFLAAQFSHYKYSIGLRSKNGKGLHPFVSLFKSLNNNKSVSTQTRHHRLRPKMKKCHKGPPFVEYHQVYTNLKYGKNAKSIKYRKNYKSINSKTPCLTFQTAYPSVRQQRSPLLIRCHKMQPFVIFRTTKHPLDNSRNNGKGPRPDQKYGYDFKSKNGKDPRSDQKYGYDFKSEKKLW